MKLRLLIIGLLSLLLLISCSALRQKAAQTLVDKLQVSVYQQTYPPAISKDNSLIVVPPQVDLSNYQSVQLRPNQRPDLAIAVAASGGGYRAANLTAGVLMGLEQITDPHLKGNLLEEVDYFSTVSGGGFGVGYYLASFYDFLQTHPPSPFTPQFSFTNTLHQLPSENPLNKDYREQLFFNGNGGELIEESLAKNILRTNKGTLLLSDIFIPKNYKGNPIRLPYWVTNSTIYQNATILPFTPDVLQRYGVNSYHFGLKDYLVTSTYQIPAVVGMTASASFPFALTPATLGSNACVSGPCYLQLLDGGLADNLGVYTALDLLRQDPAKIKILIVIDAYAGEDEPFSNSANPPYGTALFWRILGMGTDAARQLLRQNIQKVAHDELCRDSATNVLVVYLDLQHYDKARAVKTGFFITPTQQQLLFKVGQSLVIHNAQIQNLLKPLVEGNLTVGLCRSWRQK